MRALIVLLLLAGGCSTVTPEEAMLADDAQCRSFGAAPGTDVYVQCRMQAMQSRNAAQAQRRQAISEAFDDLADTPMVVPQQPVTTRTQCTSAGRWTTSGADITCRSTTY